MGSNDLWVNNISDANNWNDSKNNNENRHSVTCANSTREKQLHSNSQQWTSGKQGNKVTGLKRKRELPDTAFVIIQVFFSFTL